MPLRCHWKGWHGTIYNDQDAVPYEPEASMPDVDDYSEETFDKYISAQVLLPQGDSFQSGRVKTRKRDFDGNQWEWQMQILF
jgi:hypothetical protein